MQIGIVVLSGLLVALIIVEVLRMLRPGTAVDVAPLLARLEAIERNEERVERSVREELGRNRDEAANLGKALREEVQASLNTLGVSVREQMAEASQGQKDQLELFSGQLAALTRGNEESLGNFRQAIETRLTSFENQNTRNLEQVRSEAAANAQSMRTETGDALKAFNDSLLKSTAEVAKVQAGQLAGVAESVDKNLEIAPTHQELRQPGNP